MILELGAKEVGRVIIMSDHRNDRVEAVVDCSRENTDSQHLLGEEQVTAADLSWFTRITHQAINWLRRQRNHDVISRIFRVML